MGCRARSALDSQGIRHVLVAAADGERGFDAVIADPERRVAARYGVADEGGIVLVRPDGYIGLLANFTDDALVGKYLENVVRA